jgi:hypothetical protein
VITAKDIYSNLVSSTETVAQSFIGIVKYRSDSENINNQHQFNQFVQTGDANQGQYIMKYNSPTLASKLSVKMYYKSKTGVIKTVPPGEFNVSVIPIELDKTASSVACSSTSATAGNQLKCTVTAIKVGGAFVTESSYASALIAAVKSTSGESVLGVVSYSGLPGVYNIVF